jgi:hypothetical protein
MYSNNVSRLKKEITVVNFINILIDTVLLSIVWYKVTTVLQVWYADIPALLVKKNPTADLFSLFQAHADPSVDPPTICQ